MKCKKAVQKTWIILFIFSSAAFAGLKYVDVVDLDLGGCYFFDNAAQQFRLFTAAGGSEVTIDIGSLHIAGGGWDYSFTGKIIVTPSDLYYKNSSGQRAHAFFTNSDATLTIVASTLTDKQTAEEIVNPTTNPEGVVLLTAVMNDEDGFWMVSETGNYDNHFYGYTHYAITGGELKEGSLLRMLDFRAVWDFDACLPTNISRFDQDLYSGMPSLELIAEIPEPATMLMLGLSSMLVFAMRKAA
ncbi:MAG TPA: PEP-CTERM sorting domain-containing protein [Anaerohalosphaeraceae bacterium]|nr:PEP-CTERM sorting domain-containing protein [Anaerohalosphaeraceae bacterium]